MEHCDLVIAGGGFGGSGLAAVMSRAGFRCLVLEKSSEFVDRTKGEWIAPWGVVEAQRVGLFDDIVRARGHFLLRYARCGVRVDPQRSLDEALLMSAIPGVDGPLTQRHPDVCQTLFDAAVAAGAECVRPVTRITVVPGSAPTVEFETDGRTTTVAARLVVGADGRNSALRRQLGVVMHRDTPHHLFSGLLVDDVEGWPEDLQMTGTVDDVHFLAFPQGQGRVRLYVGFPLDQTRFAIGPEGVRRFLDAFALNCIPFDGALSRGRPVGPCATYSNESSWVDDPVGVPGVALLADAAGADDPITGQGLSITLRDIRVLAELLQAADEWTPEALAPYATERLERMRRLRFASGLSAELACAFGEAGQQRRDRFVERNATDPTLGVGRMAAFVGPDALPADVFTDDEWRRALA